jgi:hypothetical protein
MWKQGNILRAKKVFEIGIYDAEKSAIDQRIVQLVVQYSRPVMVTLGEGED